MDKYNQNKCNCESFEVPVDVNIHEIALMRMWEKIRNQFASRDEVLAIASELQKLNRRQFIQAVQTGVDGPIQPVGSDQIAHLKYENWVESEGLDASGNPVHVYNDSKNALTAAAAAMVIKQIRHDVSRAKGFEIKVCNLGDDGFPSVPSVNFNTLYITPNEDGTWAEWMYMEKYPNDTDPNPHFERIGSSSIDLKWLRGNFDKLNSDIASLRCSLTGYCDALVDVVLTKFAQPLKDLQSYVKSDEFIEWVLKNIPQATEINDGLMTTTHVRQLQKLSNEITELKTYISTPSGEGIGKDYKRNLKGGLMTENDVKFLWDTLVEGRDTTGAAAEYFGGNVPDYLVHKITVAHVDKSL